MKTFKIENGDLVFDSVNNLVMVDGVEEQKQSIERILTTNINEWFLNTDHGLDYEKIQGKGKDRQSIELALRTAIFQDVRITDVNIHEVALDGSTRHLTVLLDVVLGNDTIDGIEVVL